MAFWKYNSSFSQVFKRQKFNNNIVVVTWIFHGLRLRILLLVLRPVNLALSRTKLSELSAESVIKLKLTTSKHNEKKNNLKQQLKWTKIIQKRRFRKLLHHFYLTSGFASYFDRRCLFKQSFKKFIIWNRHIWHYAEPGP